MSSLFSLPVATLGTPRIGPHRELKFALESFWSGSTSEAQLLETAAALRAANWARQKALGISIIPSNDFSLYDHVLDTSAMVGAIPRIYGWNGGVVPLATYFAMARGSEGDGETCDHGHAHGHHGHGAPAQEMTKWFDTNYHYMVPEFHEGQTFRLASRKSIDEYKEAKSLGYQTRPVLVGPVTFLKLGKSFNPAFDPLSLLDALLPVYIEVLRELLQHGADWVQIDEPCLVFDLDETARKALRRAYNALKAAVPELKLILATYFGELGDNRDLALDLPVDGLHLDLVRAPDQLNDVIAKAPEALVLSLGVIDGRNIWRTDLSSVIDRLQPAIKKLGKHRVQIAPSCSMLHVPIDLSFEDELHPDLKSWLAFSVQKMAELTTLGVALGSVPANVAEALAVSDTAAAARKTSRKIHDDAVTQRAAAATAAMRARKSPFAVRAEVQRARFNLPLFPTTTIGSFPQTPEIRKARSAHAKGTLSDSAYRTFLQNQTAKVVKWQEKIGLDVLVHGEFERNDMVQYFGEQLSGLCLHQTRLGTVLRVALCSPTCPVRRCLKAETYDR